MRSTFLVLLLAVVLGAVVQAVSDPYDDTPTLESIPSTPATRKFRKGDWRERLNSKTVSRYRDWKQARAKQIREQFQKLSEEDQTRLKERLKNFTKAHYKQFGPRGNSIQEINAKSGDKDLYQSDITLTEQQMEDLVDGKGLGTSARSILRAKRTAASAAAKLWKFPIPYDLDSSLNQKSIQSIRDGIAFWEKSTCLRFQQGAPGTDRIRFYSDPETKCVSFVGSIGGSQDVSISNNACDFLDVTTHEIGHAMGFEHEMARFDRDNTVTINLKNIQQDFLFAYDRLSQAQIKPAGEPFDISSNMQYAPFDFAIDPKVPVSVAKDPNYQNSFGFYQPSIRDIFVMNSLYNCFAKCTTKITCQNGGMQNPNNCAACICPPGFGGALCADRDTSCGETVTISGTATTFTIKQLGNPSDGVVSSTTTRCNYFFKPAAGFTKVEVIVKSINPDSCEAACRFAGVDLYTHANPRDAGYRFCCAEHAPTKPIVTEGGLLRVIAFKRVGAVAAVLQLRAVNSAPAATTPKPNCVDAKAECPQWVSVGFCTSTAYTDATKKAYCAKSCGKC